MGAISISSSVIGHPGAFSVPRKGALCRPVRRGPEERRNPRGGPFRPKPRRPVLRKDSRGKAVSSNAGHWLVSRRQDEKKLSVDERLYGPCGSSKAIVRYLSGRLKVAEAGVGAQFVIDWSRILTIVVVAIGMENRCSF